MLGRWTGVGSGLDENAQAEKTVTSVGDETKQIVRRQSENWSLLC